MLRQHMIKEHPSDAAGRFLQSPYWTEIEQLLFRANIVDRMTSRGSSVPLRPFSG